GRVGSASRRFSAPVEGPYGSGGCGRRHRPRRTGSVVSTPRPARPTRRRALVPMTRTARLLASLVAGLAVYATEVWAGWAAGAESNGGVRIMPLGDSITDGLTVPGGYRIDLWQKLVADGYTIDFVGSQSNGPASLGDRDHEGHSGWRIDQIDANIVGWLQRYTPRTIQDRKSTRL